MEVKKDLISLVVEKNKGFFAFGEKQFLEQHKKDLKPYVSLGHGLYAPKTTYKQLIIDIDSATSKGYKNGKK